MASLERTLWMVKEAKGRPPSGPVTRRGQYVSYRFISPVLLHGQPVHLPYHRCFHRVFLPTDFPAVVHPSESERGTSGVDAFPNSPAHVGTHPLGRAAALGPGDPGFDEQDKLFIDIFISGDDRDTCVL